MGWSGKARTLQLLSCTRAVTPHQLHAWLAMTMTSRDTNTVRRHLRGTKQAGLVAANTERRPHIWYLTETALRGPAPRTTAVTGENVASPC